MFKASNQEYQQHLNNSPPVNDVNISRLPYDEAVRMFLNASDPILLEVCRKQDSTTDDGQFVAGLVICPTSLEAAQTTVKSHKKANSASNAGEINSSSQKNATTADITDSGNTATKSLALYFPPPPPMQQGTAENERDCVDEDKLEIDNIDSIRSSIRRSSLVNVNKKLDSSRANDITLNTKLEPPSSPSLQAGTSEDIKTAGDPFNSAANPQLISTAIQTDISDFVSLFQMTNATSTSEIIEQEHNLFEASLAPEIDIEEVTLRKSDSNEHLGLTVCYSQSGTINSNCVSNNANGVSGASDELETCAEVYISNIQSDSIAGRDGRLRKGDQILQVNGKDVTNKEETETLIAENNNAVTLLVSRYLYADEDDFNDTCVAGLDVEDEEDDDDEDYEEYYNENNIAYENCFMTTNNYITEAESQLNRVLLGAETTQSTALPLSTSANVPASVKSEEIQTKTPSGRVAVTTSPTKPSNTSSQKSKSFNRSQLLTKYDPIQHQSIKAHLKQVNEELARLDCRIESMTKPRVAARRSVDYDTEHIYETIPEDSESEPFYCSPYESSVHHTGLNANQTASNSADSTHLQQQKLRVAAWLNMQTSQRQHVGNVNGRNNMTHHPQVTSAWETSTAGTILTSSVRSKNGTIRSAATTAATGTTGSSSSGGDNICLKEHENSSSAYNTGSNNSGTTLTLAVNTHQTRSMEQTEIEQMAALRISKSQRVIPPKDKLTSPKHQPTTIASLKIPVPGSTSTGGFQIPTMPAQQGSNISCSQQQLPTNTMYTNMANLQQTMLLQQQLFRQALTQQQPQQNPHLNLHLQQHQHIQLPPNQQHMQTYPQFTAPNLSQYHFVNSQEVPAVYRVNGHQIRSADLGASSKAPKNEEPMVWKVKRRQDGTRYIVRRPARSRMLRDRALRINAERENHDLTTTEDDTISEIKTGRYWTREERKRHIERARERRQHQQQQLATSATMRICDKAAYSSKSHNQVAKEKQTTFTNVTLLPNQQSQLFNKLPIQNSTNLQHHQLQFSSAATNHTDGVKQKQLPLALTPAIVVGSATMTNAAHDTISCGNTIITEQGTVKTTATTALPVTAINVSSATAGTAVVATAVSQPQASAANGHKMLGLLSVTTV